MVQGPLNPNITFLGEFLILKSGFLHAREDHKIGPEPKFHVHRSSNGKDYGGKPKRGQFLTLDHMGTSLKNQNLENHINHNCWKIGHQLTFLQKA